MIFEKNDTLLFIGDSISDYDRKRPVGKACSTAGAPATSPTSAHCWAACIPR